MPDRTDLDPPVILPRRAPWRASSHELIEDGDAVPTEPDHGRQRPDASMIERRLIVRRAEELNREPQKHIGPRAKYIDEQVRQPQSRERTGRDGEVIPYPDSDENNSRREQNEEVKLRNAKWQAQSPDPAVALVALKEAEQLLRDHALEAKLIRRQRGRTQETRQQKAEERARQAELQAKVEARWQEQQKELWKQRVRDARALNLQHQEEKEELGRQQSRWLGGNGRLMAVFSGQVRDQRETDLAQLTLKQREDDKQRKIKAWQRDQAAKEAIRAAEELGSRRRQQQTSLYLTMQGQRRRGEQGEEQEWKRRRQEARDRELDAVRETIAEDDRQKRHRDTSRTKDPPASRQGAEYDQHGGQRRHFESKRSHMRRLEEMALQRDRDREQVAAQMAAREQQQARDTARARDSARSTGRERSIEPPSLATAAAGHEPDNSANSAA